MKIQLKRISIGLICTVGLFLVFLFQRQNLADMFGWNVSPVNQFFINRTTRFLLNDLFAIGLIYALFEKRKYVLFAVIVQLIGVVLFLVPYFILKFHFPSYNGPWINFLHRLILNPILVLLLIPAFYYQRLHKN